MRHEGRVENRAVYVAIGINLEGRKDVLGLWTSSSEGAKFWLNVLTELRNRGVRDVYLFCVDGLKGAILLRMRPIASPLRPPSSPGRSASDRPPLSCDPASSHSSGSRAPYARCRAAPVLWGRSIRSLGGTLSGHPHRTDTHHARPGCAAPSARSTRTSRLHSNWSTAPAHPCGLRG